jgi:gas vesicle protein
VFGRKESRTHTDQLLDELAQSYGHLKLAAGHAAGGAAEKLTPPYDKARNAASRGWISTKDAFTPMYEQMKDGAANARKGADVSDSRKNRWPMLAGLLAAGAAVGAASAMIAKRRRAAKEWDEFEPDQMLDETGYGVEGTRPADDTARDKVSTAAHTAGKKVTAGAAAVASGVSSQAGKLADALGEKSRTPSEAVSDLEGRTSDVAAEVSDKTGEVAQKATEKTADLSEKAAHSANERKKT